MIKRDPNQQFSFEFNEQGTNEVSEQIMESYNSGFIDPGTAKVDNDEFGGTEG